MIEILFLIILLIFSMFSVINLMHWTWMRFIKPEKMPKNLYTVILDKENAEEQFYYYFEKYKWSGCGFADELRFISTEKLPEKCLKTADLFDNIKIYVNTGE